MTNQRCMLALLLAFAASAVSAQVYKHVDAHGNVTFSDEPQSGAELINVAPVTTITLPKPQDVQPRERGEQGRDSTPRAIYQRLGFDAPANEEAFHSGSGDVMFRVSSRPALARGHKFEVSFNGQPIGQNEQGVFTLTNVDRGTHQASVAVVNSQGQVVQTGEVITFTLHRPSALNRP